MPIKTNDDLRRSYYMDTGRSWDNDGEPTVDYVLWLENRLIAVERAFQGWSREK
jgi:hypothetical protein